MYICNCTNYILQAFFASRGNIVISLFRLKNLLGRSDEDDYESSDDEESDGDNREDGR